MNKFQFNLLGVALAVICIAGMLIGYKIILAISAGAVIIWAGIDILNQFFKFFPEPKKDEFKEALDQFENEFDENYQEEIEYMDRETNPFTKEELAAAKADVLEEFGTIPESELDLIVFSCARGQHGQYTNRELIELVKKEEGIGLEIIEANADLRRLEFETTNAG